jgi:hypothetical protein
LSLQRPKDASDLRDLVEGGGPTSPYTDLLALLVSPYFWPVSFATRSKSASATRPPFVTADDDKRDCGDV